MKGGHKYKQWIPWSAKDPEDMAALRKIIEHNRSYTEIDSLHYGDHGLQAIIETITTAIKNEKKIALYADYDVDGTMSCVSWIWFLQALGYRNYSHYIPCRFKEGYGVNLQAIKHLVHDVGAEVIITMDTGITANIEASYCKEHGVDFICTDHHVIQAENMPDCKILNPKQHPDSQYQELCGAGITFVLLRALARQLPVPQTLWTDILALTGMATICDMVTLNAVNHKLAKLGIQALINSKRPVLRALLAGARTSNDFNESDIGFRIGPRINAVGRLNHAKAIITAFCDEEPEALVGFMDSCNTERKKIQQTIITEALEIAEEQKHNSLLFIGGAFHSGVLGVAATRLMDDYWRPTFLYDNRQDVCKGSARAIKGFDITAAMQHAGSLFTKFGGHKAAGGFSFPAQHTEAIHAQLLEYAAKIKQSSPNLWESKIHYDCKLSPTMLNIGLMEQLDAMRPFGLGFEEPKFVITGTISSVKFYRDKATNTEAHTAIQLDNKTRVMLFNQVHKTMTAGSKAAFIATAQRNNFQSGTYRRVSLDFIAKDFSMLSV